MPRLLSPAVGRLDLLTLLGHAHHTHRGPQDEVIVDPLRVERVDAAGDDVLTRGQVVGREHHLDPAPSADGHLSHRLRGGRSGQHRVALEVADLQAEDRTLDLLVGHVAHADQHRLLHVQVLVREAVRAADM